MTRLVKTIVHNWPLKLGALALSTLLYAGLVVATNNKVFEVAVPIEAIGVTSDVTILSDLGAVRQIRYYAPENLGLRIDSSSFRATVDLSKVDPTQGRTSVQVHVEAIDPRVQIIDWTPRGIVVELDAVISRTVPVVSSPGPIPSGLDVGGVVLGDTTAVVTGAASIVERVAEVQARFTIDASGIDINRMVDLVPVDSGGNELRPVDLEPAATRVKLPIFTNRQTKSLPVRPNVVGSPAAGFELASVTVDPLVISVEGDVDDLAALEVADTTPVSITGATSDVVRTTSLELPDGVQALGEATVTVTVTLRPITETRTFNAGLILVGARADRLYDLSTDRVLVTIGGSIADLDRLSGASLVVTLDVTGLDVGTHEVTVGANLITGLTLIGASPSPVSVTITPPTPSASPAPSESPGPTASPPP